MKTCIENGCLTEIAHSDCPDSDAKRVETKPRVSVDSISGLLSYLWGSARGIPMASVELSLGDIPLGLNINETQGHLNDPVVPYSASALTT